MADVTDLPPALRDALGRNDVIVFDGECVLCSAFFRFVVSRDRAKRFHFATAQSVLGQALYDALGLPMVEFETNLVIVDGRIYQRMAAFAVAMDALGWPWRAMSLLGHVPGAIADPAYRLIARNRYRIFGRYRVCLIPDAALRSRFLNLPEQAA